MENERRIEKLLRAFAKKRKADAGAPLELHPATRRLLQDEIARSVRKSQPRRNSFWQILFAGPPRRAFAVCALVSLIVSGLLVLLTLERSGAPAQLAQYKIGAPKESKPAAVPARTVAPPPAAPVVVPAESTFAGGKTVTTKADDAFGFGQILVTNSSELFFAFDDRSGGGGGGGGGRADQVSPALRTDAGDALASGVVDMDADKITTLALLPEQAKDAPAGVAGNLAANREGGLATGISSPLSLNSPMQKQTTLDDTRGLEKLPALAETATRDSSALVSRSPNAIVRFENGDESNLKQNTQMAAQRFYRLRTEAKKSGEDNFKPPVSGQSATPAGAVLDSFAVEQDGDKITVVDNDGSKYSGFIQLASDRERNISPVRRQAAVNPEAQTAAAEPLPASRTFGSLALPPPPAAQNYFFRVAGTNRSLNQSVVFSGNLVPITNTVTVANRGILATNAPNAFRFEPASQSLLMNSRIEGRAAVGGKAEIEINATPAPTP